MEFVMIVEPDEVGRKRLEAVFQTEKPSFSYQITWQRMSTTLGAAARSSRTRTE